MIGLEWKEAPGTSQAEVIKATNKVVEQLKKNPGRSALVETTTNKQASKKWRARGCKTATFASEKGEGLFDVYARWPHPDDV